MSQVNTQNEAGYDLNGNAGTALFTGTGAGTIAVSASIAANPSLIAAGNGSGPLDGSNAEAMANLQNSSSIIPAFQDIVSGLGARRSAPRPTNQTTQDQVTSQLQTPAAVGRGRLHRRGDDQPDQLPAGLLRLRAVHHHDLRPLQHAPDRPPNNRHARHLQHLHESHRQQLADGAAAAGHPAAGDLHRQQHPESLGRPLPLRPGARRTRTRSRSSASTPTRPRRRRR